MTVSYFVTGTDTEVGKTLISCALLLHLRKTHARVVGMKPVAAGTTPEGENEDAQALRTAGSIRVARELDNPYCLPLPMSPHLAARAAGQRIEVNVLVNRYQQLVAQADAVVVEGAGGFHVPLNERETGFKIYGGYKFSHVAAVEVAYTDFGLVRLNAFSFFSGNYSATAYSVGGALFLPLAPKLSGIARLGLASVGSDYSATVGYAGNSSSDSSIEPYLGFGLAYAITPKLSLTGSFDYTHADYPRGSGAATLFAVGLSYAF